jgi:hypothetical protein
MQTIETANCYDLAGQQVTISFWAKAGANFSAASSNLNVQVATGTAADQGGVSYYTWTGFSGFTNTQPITTTWTKYSFTGTIGSGVLEVAVLFYFVPVGTAGADDAVYITGVQLEAGSAASPFEYRDYGRELIMCQRYLPAFIGNGNWFGFGIASGTTQVWTTVQFPVTTRVAPTGITVSAAADFTISDAVAALSVASSVTFNTAGQQTALLLGTASSAVLTNLRPTTLLSNNANAKLLFTGCEL